LSGNSKKHLVPAFQPAVMGAIRQSDGSTFKSSKPLPAKNIVVYLRLLKIIKMRRDNIKALNKIQLYLSQSTNHHPW